jgi:hypothetical protein
MTVTVLAGALVGYMIGHEFDDLYAMRYRSGAPLHPDDISADLKGDPVALALRNDLIAVGGSAGVQLFKNGDDKLLPQASRAAGVRGILALDLDRPGGIALGSISGLYLFPPREGPGTLIRSGEILATTTAGDRIYYGVGSKIEVAPVSADTSRSWPGMDVGAAVRDIDVDSTRGIVWAMTDSALVSLEIEADSLRILSTTAMPPGGRRIAALGNTVAVALGEGGTLVMDTSDPAAPRQVFDWQGARYAYDVSLAGSRLFVAAGPEGVYILDLSTPEPTVLGLARELGFAAALASNGDYTYVLDRNSNSLRRIQSNLP